MPPRSFRDDFFRFKHLVLATSASFRISFIGVERSLIAVFVRSAGAVLSQVADAAIHLLWENNRSSFENEIIVVVLPWKLPSQTIIWASFSEIPFLYELFNVNPALIPPLWTIGGK